jgi:TonB family protein
MNKTDKIIELKELLDSGLINISDFERLKKLIFENPQQAFEEINKSKTSDFIDNIKKRRTDNSNELNKFTSGKNIESEEKNENNDSISDTSIVNTTTIPNKKSDYKFYIFGIVGFMILIFGVTFFLNNNDDNQKVKETTLVDSSYTAPKEINLQSNQENYSDSSSNNEIQKSNVNIDENDVVQEKNNEIEYSNANIDEFEDDEEIPFAVVEDVPVFPNCEGVVKNKRIECFMAQMAKHIMKNQQYPERAMEDGIQGRVVVFFIIDKQGYVTNIQAKSSIGNDILENEAKRVIELLPKFKAGMKNGRPVKVKYSQPITFKLQ